MNTKIDVQYDADPVASFGTLLTIIKTLRNPDGGCPWDMKQTVATLLPHILEETYECIDAVNNNDSENLSEEIGDLYLLTTMVSYILEQTESITISETLHGISQKLVRRHPHVFGTRTVKSADEVVEIWKNVKTDIEKKPKKDSLLDSIPLSVPPLERAYKMQKIASKAGFDWQDSHGVFKKITEEFEEFRSAYDTHDTEASIDEFGDVLFSMINAGRFMGIDPVSALHRTNQKFAKRFKYIEKKLQKKNIPLEEASLELMDSYWEEAKSLE